MNLKTRIDGPVAAIGDVHGHTEKLTSILNMLQGCDDYQDRWIIFIGDFVDRGPDSRGTLDTVTALTQSHPKTTALAGNHDLAIAAATGIVEGHPVWQEKWVDRYDSQSTFSSYGVSHGDLALLRTRMPRRHVEFLSHLPWVIEHPEYVFVHAGLDMNQRYDEQMAELRRRDLMNEWPEWLCSIKFVNHEAPIGCHRIVVSGHVNVSNVRFRYKRISIDTNGGWEGPLSCVLLPENDVLTSE